MQLREFVLILTALLVGICLSTTWQLLHRQPSEISFHNSERVCERPSPTPTPRPDVLYLPEADSIDEEVQGLSEGNDQAGGVNYVFLRAVVAKVKASFVSFVEINSGDGMLSVVLLRALNGDHSFATVDAVMAHIPFADDDLLSEYDADYKKIVLNRSVDVVESLEDALGAKSLKGAPLVVILGSGPLQPSLMLSTSLRSLPDQSLILVDVADYLAAKEMVKEEEEDYLPYVTVEAFTQMQLDFGSSIVVLKVDKGVSESVELPFGTNTAMLDLVPPLFVVKQDWVAMLRIQKCATKSLTSILKVKMNTSGCGNDFLVSPSYDETECYDGQLCRTAMLNHASYIHPTCQVVVQHHCDWNDLFGGYLPVAKETDGRRFSLTILRDPVRRVIGEYKHVYKRHRKTWDYCPSEEKNAGEAFGRESFLAFLVNPKNAWGMANRQTRMLAGCGTAEECLLTDEELLSRAKRHLLELDVVAIADRFSESVVMLGYTFGWSITNYNIAHEERDDMELDWDIDDEVQQAVSQMNHLDVELLRFANIVFAHRVDQLKEALQVESLPEFECDEERVACTLNRDDGFDWQKVWTTV